MPPPEPDDSQPNNCDTGCGSIVGYQNQTLGEALKLAGTPFSLYYKSDRTPSRAAAYSMTIPLSGASVPASLKRIDLEVSVAGRLFTQTSPPTPNQRTTFVWDGIDAYGRRVQGSQQATVRIGYVYDALYQVKDVSGFEMGIPVSGNSARQELTMWQTNTVKIGPWDARGQGLGGWTLSVLHAYDPAGRVLYLGDGIRRSANSITATINTVAGNGTSGFIGDGGLATQTTLAAPYRVAVTSDGSLYISDMYNSRIRRVGPDGIITTVAGGGDCNGGGSSEDGWPNFCGDGGPATQTTLAGPSGLALGHDGSLYIADTYNHRIRRVGPDGIIMTVVGNGLKGFSGDGGPRPPGLPLIGRMVSL